MDNKKHEWRKSEKEIYLPKTKPVIIDVPEFNYISVSGKGNPNSPKFQEYIEALYSLSYGIKMSYKKGIELAGYFQYTVYPLEGEWDIAEGAKGKTDGSWSKEDLVFNLMMRQPDFVTNEFFNNIKENVKAKKPNIHLEEARLIKITEGKCCQMMHIGSYDDEPESFKKMEDFCGQQGIKRLTKAHREIYISDFRKVAKDKLKTVLRFKVK